MMDEDATRPRIAAHEIGMDLSMLSVDELQERIGLLKDEIARLEAELSAKGASRTAAETLFRQG